jgi:hypothetical protein
MPAWRLAAANSASELSSFGADDGTRWAGNSYLTSSIDGSRLMNCRLGGVLAAALCLMASTASAVFVDLIPSGDQWIRSTNGATAFTSDAISIRDAAVTGDARWGIVQFDLSSTGYTGGDLLGATLLLNARGNTADAGQNASLIDITAGTQAIDSITWNQYQIDHVASQVPLSTLGHIAPLTPFATNAVASTSADASDLLAIAATIDGATGSLLTFVFAPNSTTTRVDWTDGPGQLDNRPSILRLEFAGDPPPCVACDVPLSDAVWLRGGSAHPNDGVLVTNNPAVVGNAPTVGLMEWDLSQIPDDPARLVSAELTFTVAQASRTQHPGQIAGLIDTSAGTPLSGLGDSAAYNSEYAGTEQMLTGLGVVPDNTAALLTGETFTTIATAADLELIRAILSGDDLLTMALFGSDGAAPDGLTGQYWGDGFFGTAPVLSLTFSVPEPSSVLLFGLAAIGGLVGIARRRL